MTYNKKPTRNWLSFLSLTLLLWIVFLLSSDISFMDNDSLNSEKRCYAKETTLFVTEGEDITEWGWKHSALIAYLILVPVISYYVTWYVEDYFDIPSKWVR